MRTILVAAILIFVQAPGWAQPVPDDRGALALSFAAIVRQSAPAVVNIYATRVVADRASPFSGDPFFSQFFNELGPSRPRVENSLGSGVIVDKSGIVVSNAHVVGGAEDIRVVLSDGREFAASVMLSDAMADLAVLTLAGGDGFTALPIADSDTAEVGDLVLAIGNPFGVGQTVTSGIVSGLARSGAGTLGRSGYLIQTDAAINPGNSGGALVDMAGRLVGINTSILSRSGGSNGIGFAIPSNLVRAFVDRARDGASEFVAPWAGVEVQPVDASLAAALGQTLPQGAVITAMHAASPFAAAGLRQGDVILDIDGAPIGSPGALQFRLDLVTPGSTATVSYLREGNRAQAVLRPGPAPDRPPADPRQVTGRTVFDGLTIARINPALIEEYGLPLDATGVLVLSARSLSARIGLRPGDLILSVNGVPATDPAALQRQIARRAAVWDMQAMRQGRVVRMRFQG